MSTPSFKVSHLERTYNSDVARAQRVQVREMLGAREGEIVADVGCGPGHLTAELAVDVDVEGRVVGVDVRPEMVAAARRKVISANCAFVTADVAELPLADESVDRAVAVQVLEYVPSVERALAEIRRALRPGGTAVVVDTDWRSAVWHTDDRNRTDAVLRAWEQHFRHPHLPVSTPRLARAAGFTSVEVVPLPMVETLTEGDTYSLGMAATIAHFVARVEPQAAKAWREDLKTQVIRGRYFFSVTRFAAVLKK